MERIELAMLLRSSLTCVLLGCLAPSVYAQGSPTAARKADLQIGLGAVVVKSDYDLGLFKGGAFYTTLDLREHFGAEFVLHQANLPGSLHLYERTYEIGPRYYRTYGRFKPYIKGMYGRGVFNFPYDEANLAYNLFAIGGGADVAVLSYVNLRADYEYQTWLSFPPSGLTPQVLTLGVAYHFPGSLKGGRRWK